ncbi:S8 family serine peptidase [Gorillibacterium sp. CAU 1737]|uniref:S8 family serine peptidase n=1 Tax=Gorillibacterium sp. CAU 1737 TaxID=3140362 RepID=UPI0032613152
MRRKHPTRIVSAVMMGLLILLLSSFGSLAPAPSGASSVPAGDQAALSDSWIVEWKDEPPAAFLAESELIRRHEHAHVTVARPAQGKSVSAWLARWSASDEAVSIQQNQSYQVAAVPNDPMLSHQTYLKQIRVPDPEPLPAGTKPVVVAVVDTGIELNHPDLASRLVEGTNLVTPGTPPMDDNGHGTNVAGVIAAVANNEKGIAGIAPNAHLMPIKALEADGTGDEDLLGEGIRYAVDHGAKIVVLSLGLNKPSTYMETVVRYAESKGVLLVAASGNEGKDVKYPAAYPTVLAVGGVMGDNSRAVLSNFGPEMDVVAPWNVFTTSLKGTYRFSGGTSLAAPQVAAVAALVLERDPGLDPGDVRTLIRETAEDLMGAGWDSETGYGLLRADRALALAKDAPIRSYAGLTKETARKLPIGKLTDLTPPGGGGAQWVKLDIAYDGYVDLTLSPYRLASNAIVEAHYEGEAAGKVIQPNVNAVYVIPVKTGSLSIRIVLPKGDPTDVLHVLPEFRMKEDRFESNDRPYTAYRLAPRSHVLTGTFHRSGDEDWFSLQVDRPGKLSLKVSTVSQRIDLTLLLQRADETASVVDRADEGKPERIDQAEVRPGLYYIRVGSIERSQMPPAGEYTLRVDYDGQKVDPREPDDRPYQASAMRPDLAYSGVISNPKDVDWFRFKVSKETEVKVTMTSEWTSGDLDLILADSTVKTIAKAGTLDGQEDLALREKGASVKLQPGTYYAKVSAAPGSNPEAQPYSLKLTMGN